MTFKHSPEYRATWYQNNKEKHHEYQRQWRKENKDKIPAYHLTMKRVSTDRYLLKMAKQRAKKKGLEFSIVREDILIPEFCPYFNEKLNADSSGYNPWFPSIDRLDSTKGYIKGNIQVISRLANHMKWTATEEQLIQFAEGVLRKAGRAFAN